MKPQNQNLGVLTRPSQECLIEGCDPDFFLMSSVVIPPLGVAPDLTAAFPGGDSTDRGLWFFQKNLPETLQSGKQYLQGGNLVTPAAPIAAQILIESMQVHMIGLQIASAFGNTPVTPKDIKVIADSGLFEMWLEGSGATPDNPTFSDYPDLSVPVVTMPSHIGVYGNTVEAGQGVSSLGVPGIMFAAELREKPILARNQLIGARLSFPALTSIQNGFGAASTAAAPVLSTPTGVLVRLFLFGKAKYRSRSL